MSDQFETAVAEIKPETSLEVFTKDGGLDPILGRIRVILDEFTPDVSTPKGRKEIASIAYSVARSKTYLDSVGKELVDQHNKIPKQIDAARKQMRDTLDAWKDDVRAPLTSWEDAEKDRIARVREAIDEFDSIIADASDQDSVALQISLDEVRAASISEQFFGEFLGEAVEKRDQAAIILDDRLAAALVREREAAELERLREAEAARLEKEREVSIAQKAKEQAELRAKQAEQRAREELEASEKAKRAEAERREADRAHRAKINNEAVSAFVENDVSEETAKTVISLIANRQIPFIQIIY